MLLAIENGVGVPGREPITVSIGVAEWSEGMSCEATVDAADRAVLDAKARGGGRVVAARGKGRPRRRLLGGRLARGSGANGNGLGRYAEVEG
jgi:hypothetical protein